MPIRRYGICKQSCFQFLWTTKLVLEGIYINLLDRQAKDAVVRVGLCTQYRGRSCWLLPVAPIPYRQRLNPHKCKRWGDLTGRGSADHCYWNCGEQGETDPTLLMT